MTTLLSPTDLFLPHRRRAVPPRRGVLSRCGGTIMLVATATVGVACTSAPTIDVESGLVLAPMPTSLDPVGVEAQRDLRLQSALVMMPVLPGGTAVSNVVQALNLDDRRWPTLLSSSLEQAIARTTLTTFARLTVGWPEMIFASNASTSSEGNVDRRWFGPSREANTQWLTSISLAGWLPELPLESPWAMEPVLSSHAVELASAPPADTRDPLHALLAAAWPIDFTQGSVFAFETIHIELPVPLAPVPTLVALPSADPPEPAHVEPLTANTTLAPVPAMRRPVAIEFLIPLIAMAFLIFVVMVPAVCAAAPRFIVPSTSTGYPPARASPRRTNGMAPAKPSLSAIARALAAFPAY